MSPCNGVLVISFDTEFDVELGAGSCRSWYKGGTTNGRVSGLWPGSIMHVSGAFSTLSIALITLLTAC